MSDKVCERCGASPVGYQLLDYCYHCSKDLCDKCMEKGCCGHVPAISGEADDAEARDLYACSACDGSGGIASTEDRHGRRQICPHCEGTAEEPKV